jgi:5-methylthioribose kinase
MEISAPELNDFLLRTGLLNPGETAKWTSLKGGVSSEIWRVDLPDQTVCVKRALETLKVKADWHAPVERNLYEWEWFNFVYQHFPEIVPRPVAHDSQMQMLSMEFLEPADHKLWKTELLNGNTDSEFAEKVGDYLGKIHSLSSLNSDLAQQFATDKFFFALRIEAYLLATAEKYPAMARHIKQIAEQTLSTKIALVHGDVSPKNILIGKENPVFLDAETAWYGDPAFDVAFCLNHFLLKAVFRPVAKSGYFACFKSFTDSYLNRVNWEFRSDFERRVCQLLPVLFLARVDGKSPVEYITDQRDKKFIRQKAQKIISGKIESLEKILQELG